MTNWFSVTIDGEDLEEKCSLLFEHGISGITYNPDGTALCFLQSDSTVLNPDLQKVIEDLNLTVISVEKIEDKNWTQSCDELFEPICAGNLNIIPLRSATELCLNDQKAKNNIIIIPGTGFGTGHHSTTFNLLKLLQHQEISSNIPISVLDAGTGSGILAIAACRLYNCQVDAYEVDPLAIENASDNVRLNKLENKVHLFCQSVHHCLGKYDLIIANLYAELLETLCFHLTERGHAHSRFLLSGIRADLAPGIVDKYEKHGLRCIENISTDGWSALLLRP